MNIYKGSELDRLARQAVRQKHSKLLREGKRASFEDWLLNPAINILTVRYRIWEPKMHPTKNYPVGRTTLSTEFHEIQL